MPTAPDDVWDIAIKVCLQFFRILNAQSCQALGPKAERWRNRPFPLYDDILTIVDGIIATGENSFRAGRDDAGTLLGKVSGATEDEGNLADEDDSPKEFSDPFFIPATPTPAKRSAQPMSDLLHSAKRQRANAASYQRLCGALETLASSMAGPSHAAGDLARLETTPERRARAIALVEDSDDLSDNEQLQAIDLFTEKPEFADAYVAIKKPSLRAKFLQGKLEKYLFHTS